MQKFARTVLLEKFSVFLSGYECFIDVILDEEISACCTLPSLSVPMPMHVSWSRANHLSKDHICNNKTLAFNESILIVIIFFWSA